MYALVNVAALVRVGGGALLPESLYLVTVATAALFWMLAFATYAVRYAPILLRPRADGRPG
jgi:uncharacterized protein involved in response to NO